MRKFTVVVKPDENSIVMKEKIVKQLTEEKFIYDEETPSLVICVGGDGTLLHAVHQYIDVIDKMMFVGIRAGTLGFFTDYIQSEIDLFIQDIIEDKVSISTSRLLEIDMICERSKKVYALNEMRIENVIKTQVLDIFINDEEFETFHGTGICLSTQAGSTAYNRSLRGAVIDNGLEVMQMAEITGIQHSRYRSLDVPYIMKEDRVVTFKSQDFEHAILCYDHLSHEIKNMEKVVCRLSKKEVRFARYRPYSYLKRIKTLY